MSGSIRLKQHSPIRENSALKMAARDIGDFNDLYPRRWVGIAAKDFLRGFEQMHNNTSNLNKKA